jgi:hypothetical protein
VVNSNSIDVENILIKFLDFEVKNDLFSEVEFSGIKYWHYVRTPIYLALQESIFQFVNLNSQQKTLEPPKSIKDKALIRFRESTIGLQKRDMLVFSHERRVKQKDCYKCIYTDEWLDKIGKSYYVFEQPHCGGHLLPVKTRNIRYLKLPSGDNYNFDSRKLINNLIDLLIRIEKEFSISFSNDIKKRLCNYLIYCFATYKKYRKVYAEIINKVQPKVIVLVVHYNFCNMVLIELAKEMHIPTIELEHGVISNGHIAYNFKRRMDLKAFPDFIFTFGRYDAEVPSFPFERWHAIPVGNVELEKKAKYYKEKLKRLHKKKKIITFLSDNNAELIQCACRLSKMLDKTQYDIKIKLHPSEYTIYEKKYPFLKYENIKVYDDSKHPIYYFLAVSDYVVSCNSTTLYEATMFGCNILILKAGEYFRSLALVEQGCAQLVQNEAEIVECTKQEKDILKMKTSYFFEENSVDNINKQISMIMKNNKYLKKN